MKNTTKKINFVNKFILLSSSLLVIFLFGIFIGSRVKQFQEPNNATNIQASSPQEVKVDVLYKVIKEVKKEDLKQ